MNPFKIVTEFEGAVCDYTGAPYCVATTSCTTAILLSCLYWKANISEDALGKIETVEIPKRTYIGVAQSIRNAGFKLKFRDEDWAGGYRLLPLPIWDYARRFTSNMYVKNQMQCVSLGWTKILAVGQGGLILHDNPDADKWLRRARYDGRTEGVSAEVDIITHPGYHVYMMPRDAAEGLSRLAALPKHNADLPTDNYPDLSKTFLR